MPQIHGREVISRADMAARGVPKPTAARWYQDRAKTGHPEKAGRIGREDYWYEDEWTAWRQEHQAAKRATLTEIDRSGDPDDLVDAAEAARIMRYKDRNVIYANERAGDFPARDQDHPPRWRRATVWAFADQRRGRGGGRPAGTPNSPKPEGWHPYQTGPGAARLAQVRALLDAGEHADPHALAVKWDVSTRTAERVISAARALQADQVTTE